MEGRSLVGGDKLVEVEGMVTARGREDTDSGRREQAGNLLEKDNLPESGDGWGRGGHCRQGAEELMDSQTRTFSFSLCLFLYFVSISADVSSVEFCPMLIVTLPVYSLMT